MSRDPFDLLREQLVTAATPARRRRRARPLVVLAATLALGGTATAAAVLTLGGEPSPPLKGPVPGATGGAARQYAIVLRPDLRVGVAGWCSSVALRGARGAIGAGTGCGPALASAFPQVAGGGMTVSPTRIIDYRVVDARVAVVRLPDGRRIVPRADPGLPFGWRATVAFTTTTRGRFPAAAEVALLDARGRVLARSGGRTGDVPGSVPDLPTRPVDARHPPDAPCAIAHRALPHLAAIDQTIVRGDLAGPVDALGHPFRTCSAALFRLAGVRLRAAVLVDARGPARTPAQLPRGYVPSRASARRTGRAWLVVDGGTKAARDRLLGVLDVDPPRR